MRTRIRLPFGGELGLTQVLSEETTLDRQGEFVTMPNDKTLCIPLHETWPEVPEPSRLGPWAGNQEPGL